MPGLTAPSSSESMYPGNPVAVIPSSPAYLATPLPREIPPSMRSPVSSDTDRMHPQQPSVNLIISPVHTAEDSWISGIGTSRMAPSGHEPLHPETSLSQRPSGKIRGTPPDLRVCVQPRSPPENPHPKTEIPIRQTGWIRPFAKVKIFRTLPNPSSKSFGTLLFKIFIKVPITFTRHIESSNTPVTYQGSSHQRPLDSDNREAL